MGISSSDLTNESSIVFVHGLQGHPRNTWTWEAEVSQPRNLVTIESPPKKNVFKLWTRKGKSSVVSSDKAEPLSAVFWPYHLLPKDCPNSRVFTWGYDSTVSNFFNGSASKKNVLSHARDLLGDLSGERVEFV